MISTNNSKSKDIVTNSKTLKTKVGKSPTISVLPSNNNLSSALNNSPIEKVDIKQKTKTPSSGKFKNSLVGVGTINITPTSKLTSNNTNCSATTNNFQINTGSAYGSNSSHIMLNKSQYDSSKSSPKNANQKFGTTTTQNSSQSNVTNNSSQAKNSTSSISINQINQLIIKINEKNEKLEKLEKKEEKDDKKQSLINTNHTLLSNISNISSLNSVNINTSMEKNKLKEKSSNTNTSHAKKAIIKLFNEGQKVSSSKLVSKSTPSINVNTKTLETSQNLIPEQPSSAKNSKELTKDLKEAKEIKESKEIFKETKNDKKEKESLSLNFNNEDDKDIVSKTKSKQLTINCVNVSPLQELRNKTSTVSKSQQDKFAKTSFGFGKKLESKDEKDTKKITSNNLLNSINSNKIDKIEKLDHKLDQKIDQKIEKLANSTTKNFLKASFSKSNQKTTFNNTGDLEKLESKEKKPGKQEIVISHGASNSQVTSKVKNNLEIADTIVKTLKNMHKKSLKEASISPTESNNNAHQLNSFKQPDGVFEKKKESKDKNVNVPRNSLHLNINSNIFALPTTDNKTQKIGGDDKNKFSLFATSTAGKNNLKTTIEKNEKNETIKSSTKNETNEKKKIYHSQASSLQPNKVKESKVVEEIQIEENHFVNSIQNLGKLIMQSTPNIETVKNEKVFKYNSITKEKLDKEIHQRLKVSRETFNKKYGLSKDFPEDTSNVSINIDSYDEYDDENRQKNVLLRITQQKEKVNFKKETFIGSTKLDNKRNLDNNDLFKVDEESLISQMTNTNKTQSIKEEVEKSKHNILNYSNFSLLAAAKKQNYQNIVESSNTRMKKYEVLFDILTSNIKEITSLVNTDQNFFKKSTNDIEKSNSEKSINKIDCNKIGKQKIRKIDTNNSKSNEKESLYLCPRISKIKLTDSNLYLQDLNLRCSNSNPSSNKSSVIKLNTNINYDKLHDQSKSMTFNTNTDLGLTFKNSMSSIKSIEKQLLNDSIGMSIINNLFQNDSVFLKDAKFNFFGDQFDTPTSSFTEKNKKMNEKELLEIRAKKINKVSDKIPVVKDQKNKAQNDSNDKTICIYGKNQKEDSDEDIESNMIQKVNKIIVKRKANSDSKENTENLDETIVQNYTKVVKKSEEEENKKVKSKLSYSRKLQGNNENINYSSKNNLYNTNSVQTPIDMLNDNKKVKTNISGGKKYSTEPTESDESIKEKKLEEKNCILF